MAFIALGLHFRDFIQGVCWKRFVTISFKCVFNKLAILVIPCPAKTHLFILASIKISLCDAVDILTGKIQVAMVLFLDVEGASSKLIHDLIKEKSTQKTNKFRDRLI